MHGFRIIPSANITYSRSQNYTNTMVDEHGIRRTFEVVIVVLLLLMLSFDVCLHKCTSLIVFKQVVSSNILKF